MTTLISFLYSLKQALPANATAIDNIANMSGVGSATSVYDISDIAVGTTEPTCRTAIYQDLTLGSSLTNQALNEDPGSSTAGKNKYCATKYYKITGNGSSKTITMAPTGCDADIYLYKNGSIIAYDNDGGSGVSESITYTLENNVVYILDVRLYSGTSCTFTVSTN